MRRIARLPRSIDLLRLGVLPQTSFHYLCFACKSQCTPFSTSTIRSANKVPLTEKLRQKIWGKDKTPGSRNIERNVTGRNAEDLDLDDASYKGSGAVPYEPATTWDGLDRVGGYEKWWKEQWDPLHQFKGFLPKVVMKDNKKIEAAVHRAIVEVLAMREAGLNVEDVARAEPGEDLTWGIQVVMSENGESSLQFPERVDLQNVIKSLAPPLEVEAQPTQSEEDLEADKSEDDPLHPEEMDIDEHATESQEDLEADKSEEDPLEKPADHMTSWDPAWLQVSLEDVEFKFAVIKRTMQLTGIRFPDSAINSTKTTKALLSHLVIPPKPRKLSQALQAKEELVDLPNVKVFNRRITSVDKEKRVGRWKIIEKELKERDLPVTGHRHLS